MCDKDLDGLLVAQAAGRREGGREGGTGGGLCVWCECVSTN